MEKTLEEKLGELRTEKYEYESDRKEIEEWKTRVPLLTARKEWIMHPTTVQLAEEIRIQLERIKRILINDETISELDRKVLQREKKFHEIYLSFITRDPTQELEVIEKQVDEAVKIANE